MLTSALSALLPRIRDRNDANLIGNAPYCLQRVQFVGCRLTIFATLLRAMDRSNANFSEGAKPLFLVG